MQTKLRIPVMFITSSALMWYFLNKIGFHRIYHNIIEADLMMLLLACLFIPLTVLVRTLRWYLLVGIVVPHRRLSDAFKSFLCGSFMALITPGKMGDLGRGLYYQNKKKELTALVFYEKLTDLFAYALFSIPLALKIKFGYGLILAIFVLFVFYILIHPAHFSNFILCNLPLSVVKRFKVDQHFILIDQVPKKTRGIILLSLLITVITVFHFHFIINTFGSSALSVTFMVFPLSILLASIPISIGGLGVREGAIILLFTLYNVPKEAALNASVFFYITNIIPYIFGIIYLPIFLKNLYEPFKRLRYFFLH